MKRAFEASDSQMRDAQSSGFKQSAPGSPLVHAKRIWSNSSTPRGPQNALSQSVASLQPSPTAPALHLLSIPEGQCPLLQWSFSEQGSPRLPAVQAPFDARIWVIDATAMHCEPG